MDLGPPDWLNLYKICLQWPYFQMKSHSELLEMKDFNLEIWGRIQFN